MQKTETFEIFEYFFLERCIRREDKSINASG